MKFIFLSLGLLFCTQVTTLGQTQRTVSVVSENEVRGTAGILDIALSSDRKVKVACVGNSITYGHGVEDRVNNSYPAQLGKMLGSGFNVGNYGASGAYLVTKAEPGWAYIEMGQYAPSKNFNPDVVIIKLGTNDTKPKAWAYIDDFDKDYSALIKSYRDLPSKPLVILCYPMAVYYTNYGINDANQQLLRPKIKAVAEREGCQLIDFYSVTKGRPELAYDGVHPNANGTLVMARLAHQRFIDIMCNKHEVTSDKPVTVFAAPKEGYEFVEWTDGTTVYTKNPLVYTGNESTKLVAKFRRIGETYCQPWGTTEASRYLKQLWAEVNENKVDLIGSDSTKATTHPGKIILNISDAAIVASPGDSFTLKSISNNPDSSATVDPIRRSVIFPFIDWDRDMEFGGSNTNEALPMIGRAGNCTTDADAQAVVSLNQTIQIPADAKLGKTTLRLCYTDGFSSTAGLGESEPTHTACSPIEKGFVVDITLQIVPSEGEFSFNYIAGEKGSVVSDHEIGLHPAATAIRLKAIPESNHVEFVSWTDENNNIISTRPEFVYYISQNIVLKANFKDRQYPQLVHWYANASQSNRFLNKVTARPLGSSAITVLLDLGANPTKIPVNKDLKDGTAMVSVLSPKIRIPKGRTSFTLTCYSTHNVVEGYNNELGWTNQAILVDWNQNYAFEAGNEMTGPTTYGGANTVNHAFGNAAGFAKTIAIPAQQPVGTYRMYLVYGEPASATPTWPVDMVKEGNIRMGNVYEFDIEIYDASTDNITQTPNGGIQLVSNESNHTLTQLKKNSQIQVYNATGQMIINSQVSASNFSFQTPAKGSYFVRVTNPKKQTQTFRIVQ